MDATAPVSPPLRPRLRGACLDALPPAVARPSYDPSRTRTGIVHFGPGAFHRAHQAVYIDALLADAPDWAISAVSLHSSGVRDALRPQDGLYTLALLDERPSLRVIGAIREVLCARDEADVVLSRLSDPAVRLVTLTITEKGYCLAGGELDMAHPDIVHDLARPDAPVSAIGYLVAGLRARRLQGMPPYTVLSCDNLPDNGGKLRRACVAYACRLDPALAEWIDARATFPRSMVDSITPASDEALRERVADALGCVDAWPVQREPYAQWVVEDAFCAGRPDWERVGVTMSADIAGYDRAKLRLLNAPHSALAYLGLLLGLESVAEAMRHPALGPFVERLLRVHIAPNLALPRGLDADAYIGAILARFANPAVRHRLAQIAQDGSQKIPVRLLDTIGEALDREHPIDALCLPVAAWLQFVRRETGNGAALADPLAVALAEAGHAASGDAAQDVARFLRIDAVFGPLAADARFVQALRRAYARLGDGGASAVGLALGGH
ncbi:MULTISPECIES: mannitol dehydrogenase family protein [Stenotrophomonas]|uniref:Mannitol dehydrogenase n=1 Tax=Stenotrophomonas nitritireducens TaxID=83617 RepID=A0ABR5NK44_9GAMM|nr:MULTISPECIES: mannitol dehydrogenase family protein [Stenotrophomonas]KQN98009.1 mannitol dehydrogenase [Stenotrophomonas sp. Leaf70]KRG57519.1 mannitol dehydrogenase [Stenotrophomonas nitritireducens]